MKISTLLAGLGVALAATAAVAAGDWKPTAQVEYAVPAGPGGAVDTYARVIKQVFDSTGALDGQNFLVSNRPGGDGLLALGPLTQHRGNAHWFSMLSSGFLLRQAQGDYKLDIPKDLTIGPILFEETLAVAVKADSPLRNVNDLLERLRKDSASLRIAVAPSVYNHIHIGILAPLRTAGVPINQLTVAPFRSSAESVTALYGGHVDVVSASVTNVVAGVKAGRLRLLAVSSSDRLKGALAAVPTWREQGVDSVFTSVQGILFPRGLSPEQLRFWDERFQALSQSQKWQDALKDYEMTPTYMDHKQANQYVHQQLSAMKVLMDKMGLVK